MTTAEKKLTDYLQDILLAKKNLRRHRVPRSMGSVVAAWGLMERQCYADGKHCCSAIHAVHQHIRRRRLSRY